MFTELTKLSESVLHHLSTLSSVVGLAFLLDGQTLKAGFFAYIALTFMLFVLLILEMSKLLTNPRTIKMMIVSITDVVTSRRLAMAILAGGTLSVGLILAGDYGPGMALLALCAVLRWLHLRSIFSLMTLSGRT